MSQHLLAWTGMSQRDQDFFVLGFITAGGLVALAIGLRGLV